MIKNYLHFTGRMNLLLCDICVLNFVLYTVYVEAASAESLNHLETEQIYDMSQLTLSTLKLSANIVIFPGLVVSF